MSVEDEWGRTLLLCSIFYVLLSKHLCKPKASAIRVKMRQEGPCAALRLAGRPSDLLGVAFHVG